MLRGDGSRRQGPRHRYAESRARSCVERPRVAPAPRLRQTRTRRAWLPSTLRRGKKALRHSQPQGEVARDAASSRFPVEALGDTRLFVHNLTTVSTQRTAWPQQRACPSSVDPVPALMTSGGWTRRGNTAARAVHIALHTTGHRCHRRRRQSPCWQTLKPSAWLPTPSHCAASNSRLRRLPAQQSNCFSRCCLRGAAPNRPLNSS
jgi:hypothetical protein